MDIVNKSVRNTDGNTGVVKSLRIEEDKIEVYFDAYNEIRTYKFSLALNHSLNFIDREVHLEAERLAVLAKESSKKREITNKKKEEKSPYSIYYKPDKVERVSYRDNYDLGYSKRSKSTINNDLSQAFNSLKRTIKNASYDLKQPELKRKEPANKEEYYPDKYDECWDQACYVL